KTSADSLLTVINDILDFAKIEAGKLDLQEVEFNLPRALEETLKPLAVRAQQKKLRLQWQVAAGVPPQVVGDAGRLRQILVNLVGNAIKFTEAGGAVRVSIESAQAFDASAVELQIAVEDTGIGIASEKQRVIFAAFAQADGSTARRY